MTKYFCLTALFVLLAGIRAGFPDSNRVKITVYNQGFALIRQRRILPLSAGTHRVKIQDIPALIDPGSVYFKSISHPDEVKILEQQYDYDLASPGKLWDKYLGKEVEIESTDPETRNTVRHQATLLSTGWTFANGGWSQTGTPIVEMGGKVYVQPQGQIVLPAVSASEFLLRPSLEWLIKSPFSGDDEIDFSYLANGFIWSADYLAVTDASDTSIGLTGWASVTNTSGASFHDALLQFMAGNLHTVERAGYIPPPSAMAYNSSAQAPQIREKPFFEYHLYTLARPADLENDETKQFELLSAGAVPFKKIYRYDGAPSNIYYEDSGERENAEFGLQSDDKVRVMMEFDNRKENGLGIPLPAGRIRVYQTDENGSRQFVGEDNIDHTPKDEKVRLNLGDVFEVTGERKQTAFTQIVQHHVYDESFQINLKNHKSVPVTVSVVEHLWRGLDWTITQSSDKFQKLDSHTIEFPVAVPAGGNSTVAYTVRYKW